jgi:Flp pilus assembly protein TadG
MEQEASLRTQPPTRSSCKLRGRRGQSMIMVTLGLVPMFGMIGLVTDIGYMHFVKESAQTAAEAAASAAIIQYHATMGGSFPSCSTSVCASTSTSCPTTITTPANPVQNGCMYAYNQGFTDVRYTAGVNSVPPTVSGTGTASYWVTFYVIKNVPQMFSAVMGNTSGAIAARSTGAVFGATDCIYALQRTGTGLLMSGNITLTSACGIYVNSSDPTQAINGNGSYTVAAPEYDIVGGTTTTLSPAPNQNVSPVSDPLASLPAPASAPYTCTYTNYDPTVYGYTLSPGTYCGGIHVGTATYTLSPGNYILVGGGLSTQSTNSHLIGTSGVMIYNTFGASTSGTYSFQGNNLSANSDVTLKAQTTGTYAGILFFDDRNAPSGSADSYGGGSTSYFEGTIYAPTVDITYSGTANTLAKYTLLVANTIHMVGNSTVSNDYSSLPNGSPLQQTVIIE